MTYKTRTLIAKCSAALLSIGLCLATANCGDPASGVWINAAPPSASASQYASYMVTLTFGDAQSVTVDLETMRKMGALQFAGCSESIMGTGTYTEMDKVIASTFTTATTTRSNCVYMADNQMSTTLDTQTTALLVGLSSGTFLIANDTLTFTVSGGSKVMYMKGH